jgi:hypothetical protein
MNPIIKTDEYEITQDPKNKTLFTIAFTNTSTNEIKSTSPLLKSLVKPSIILGATIYDNYKSMSFKAHSIKTLNQYKTDLTSAKSVPNFSYLSTLKLVYYLTKQISYLIEEESQCFYQFTPENIIVIDNSKFIYLSLNHLKKIIEGTELMKFIAPFDRDGFVSPELLAIKSVPSTINYRTIYYSLGLLIMDCLFDYLREEIDITDITNITNNNNNNNIILNPIKETQLFYLIKRCLHEDPTCRVILHF